MLKRITWATLLMLAVTTCGSKATATPPNDISSYESQSISWDACPSGYFLPDNQLGKSFKKDKADCTFVTVPALYAGNQSLSDFKIAMMRQPATGPNKLGTLFINPGGPGESGIEELQWPNFPAEVRKTYDIVGFDPRGVNHSAPVMGHQIKCNTKAGYESFWVGESSPENDKQYLKSLDRSDSFYRNCSKDNPNWWTLTTSNVVDDLELMRKVVAGNQPLDFLGSSYGTTIAAQYITRYPDQVGHIALDSPTTNDPAKPAARIAEAKALESNVLRLVRGYAKHKKISVSAVKKLMLEVRNWGDDNKLLGFAGMRVLDPVKQVHLSNEFMFTVGIFAMTYWDIPSVQKYFNQGMDEVTNYRRNDTFEWYAMNYFGYDTDSLGGSTYNPDKIKRNNSYEILDIVNSMDLDPIDKTTRAQRERLYSQLDAASPFWNQLTADPSNYWYKGKREGLSWTGLAKSDASIPNPPRKKPTRTNTSGKAVLVVGSKYESTTPFPFAVQTAKELRSPLVTFNGTVHAPVVGFDNRCLNKIFINYFVHNKLPSGPVTCTK